MTLAEPLYAYVGRQAIFDRGLDVVAYELLYRDSEENRAQFSDPNHATAATMLNAFVELGLENIAGDLPIYINLPADFLLGRYPLPLPPHRTYIEVLEDVPVTPAVIDALRAFRRRGFRIALDDFLLTEETRPLVALADVIKISVLGVSPQDVAAQYATLRGHCDALLAEKISTNEEMEHLRALGFDLFQGHFLQLPIISRTRRLPYNRAVLLPILVKLCDPGGDPRVVEALISADVGLSVRLLRLASSVVARGAAPIGSLGEAIARLGAEQIAALVLVVLASGFDDKPIELTRQALVRARMCEALARCAELPPDQLFTAGLLSLVDAMLDRPLADVLDQLPVTPLIRGALAGDLASGPAARILAAARGQDRGDLASVAASGLPPSAVLAAWFEAICWADDLIATL
ncbi:MAG TPA: HDOD domain-containing protein [Kofleriaceae bacterium]|nr:HDOD domain-containing protein [Kofleriaceae bacterium]